MGCCYALSNCMNNSIQDSRTILRSRERELPFKEEELAQNYFGKSKRKKSIHLIQSKALKAAGIYDLSSAINQMDNTEEIANPNLLPVFSFVAPSTIIGSLALSYIYFLSCDLVEFVQDFSSFLSTCLAGDHADMRDWTLLLIEKALRSEKTDLKSTLVKANVIEHLVKLMRNNTQQIRLLAAEVCARIYRDFENGQRLFFRCNGENQLVQLIKREEDDEPVLRALLDMALDLIYVLFI